jgi:hypothetical protein
MSTTIPQFDIHTWNQMASAKLREEFQKMAVILADNLEKPKGHGSTAQYLGGVPTSAIIPPSPSPASRQHRRSRSRTIWFALVGVFFAELPAVISASPENRASAIGSMITNMGFAAVGAGATVVVVDAIKQVLQGTCEGIVTRATSNLAVSTLYITLSLTAHFCRSLLVPSLPPTQGYVVCGLTGFCAYAFVTNAFTSLWHLLGASFAQAPKTAERKMELFQECWSSDRLVTICASGMAAAVVVTGCSMVFANPVAVGIAAGFLHVLFCEIMDKVVERKQDRGVTWCAWVRGLIVSDDRARMWTTDDFDLVEEAITKSLICPITKRLVYVVPLTHPRTTKAILFSSAALTQSHILAARKDAFTNDKPYIVTLKDMARTTYPRPLRQR